MSGLRRRHARPEEISHSYRESVVDPQATLAMPDHKLLPIVGNPTRHHIGFTARYQASTEQPSDNLYVGSSSQKIRHQEASRMNSLIDTMDVK